MRLICLNAWGGTLHDPLLAYLADEAPDILCLQEVVHTPDAPAPTLEYRDGTHILPQRARLFDEVRAALPDHVATFCPAAQGVLWDHDRPVPSQWGLATYVHRRLIIVAQLQGFVHGSFSHDGYGDHPRSRSAHAVRVWDGVSGRAVSVAHMHGLRDPAAGKSDTPQRAAQARKFAALLTAVTEDTDSLIACGDFNVEPDSRTLTLLGALGLTDLVTARNEAGTRTSHYARSGRFADYMMVSDDLAGAPFQVVRDPEISDHCPLILTIG